MVTIDKIKQLREITGISITECKKALEEAGGDIKRAKEVLREKGKDFVKGREGRATTNGLIASYIHATGKIGVLLELHCESDFIARSEELKKLAHELCLQIAAASPLFVSTADIPEEFLERERKIYQKQFAQSAKPQHIVNQIIEGKLKKYREEVSLLCQGWVKDDSKTVQDLINETKSKVRENIIVKRFVRYEI